MENKSAIIEKLQKLLALAERGGTEAEAENAMSKVQALLSSYNLSMTDVETYDADPVTEQLFPTGSKMSWKDLIAKGVSDMCFCRVIKSSHLRGIIIIGKLADITAARYLTEYLIQTGENLAKQAGGDRSFKIGWKKGYGDRIAGRCIDMARAARRNKLQDANGTDLILHPLFDKSDLVNQTYVNSRYPVTRKGAMRSVTNNEGFRAGGNAGSSVSLSTNNITSKAQLTLGR